MPVIDFGALDLPKGRYSKYHVIRQIVVANTEKGVILQIELQCISRYIKMR
jgi:hypothetical protein